MSQTVGVDLNLDAQQYVQAAGLAMASTTGLEQSLSRLAVQAGLANRAMSMASPSPAHIAGFAGLAAAAMASQQQLAGLNATQAITGQSAQKLSNTIRQMARDMPIGQRAAQQIVETVTQLGVSGSGSESKIAALSKTVARLQGATGEFGPALAQGLTQLDRAFGNQSLDPKRVGATADSLTTVSKSAGTSAQSVLDFSNSLAPMAKQAGIGESATLGIAAAFSQVGQDGTAATTAVSKMLSDMNRAVRDGTGDMNIYANAVGMTRQQFEQLFKANPAGALTQVTKALSSGSQGARTLDALGLDSTRTQRSLLAVSQGGSLQKFIDDAVNSRGDNSTAKGARAAWNTTADEFTKLGSAAGQVAVALGTPLLAPLKLFAQTLGAVVKPVAGFLGDRHGTSILASGALGVGSGLLLNRFMGGPLGMGRAAMLGGLGGAALGGTTGGDGIASGVMTGAIGLMMARRLFGVGLGVQTARQFSSAGIFGAARAGFSRGRGSSPMRDSRGVTFGFPFGRTAGYIDTAQQEGRLTPEEGFMPGIFGRIYRGAERVGGAFPGGGGGSPFSALRTIGQGGLWAGAAYGRVLQASAQMGSEPDPMQRKAIWDNAMKKVGIGSVIPADVRATVRGGGKLSDEQMTRLNESIRGTAKEMGTLSNVARSTGSAFASVGKGLVGGIGAVGRGIGSTLGFGNLALMAGFAGGSYLMNSNRSASAQRDQFQQQLVDEGPSGTMSKYLESVGRATDATTAFATSAQLSATTLAGSVRNMGQALAPLSDAEKQVAASTRNQMVQNFNGASTQSVAAQVKLLMGGSNDPSAMESIKLDLARQYSPDQVNQILGQLQKPGPFNFGNPKASQKAAMVPTGYDSQSVGQAANDISNANVYWLGHGDTNQVRKQDYYGFGTGTFVPKPHLQNATRDELKRFVQGVSTLHDRQAGVYGGKYAAQEQYQSINQAMLQASHSGNEAAVDEMGDAFAKSMGYQGKIPRITSSDINKAGGYIQALEKKSPQFAAMVKGMGPGIQLNPGGTGGITATAQHGDIYNQLKNNGISGPMLSYYDNTLSGAGMPAATGNYPPGFVGPVPIVPKQSKATVAAIGNKGMQDARSAVLNYSNTPGNTQYQDTAVQKTIQSMSQMGMSLDDIIKQATGVAGALDDVNSSAYQLANAQIAAAQAMQQAKAPFQTPEAAAGAELNTGITLSQTKGQSDAAKAARASGVNDITDANGKIEDSLKQRIQMWYQYNTSVDRATHDFGRQQERAQLAFSTQQGDAQADYLRNRLYMEEDYHRQVSRATEDFNIQQARAERDYNIQTQRAQEDYFTQRGRAIRDFNKQLTRDVQDQVKALYDPYHRIQTQAIWDANSLISNLGEQNAAISKQASQLQQLRHAGVSNQTMMQLDLNNPQNAQQLNQLVGDLFTDPKLVSQLNATVGARVSLGSMLVEDPTNKDIARARDDFNTQLKDMEFDYHKSMGRAKADFTRQMGDQVVDFNRQMGRMAQDFQTSLDRSDTQYQVSAMRAARDFNVQMGQMTEDYQTQLKRMHEDVITATKSITGGIDDLWKTLQATMKGQNTAANKVMKDGLSDTLTVITNNKGKYADAYKNLFPYDLSKLFAGGTGGPEGAAAANAGAGAGHGGPYAPYSNAAAQQFFNNVGGMGTQILPSGGAKVSQGYGAKTGGPNTGGGWPVTGSIVSQLYGHDGHPGIDLSVGRGTPIMAPLSGLVVYAGWNDGYGNCVIMDDGGGRSTLYGHQESIKVHVGDQLKPGDLIGWVDSTGNSTGNHLHFETRMDGKTVDPAIFLPQWQATDGLGSFDPMKTASAYGVLAGGLDGPMLDPKKYEERSKHLGPWGGLLALYEAERDGTAQMQSLDGTLTNTFMGLSLPGNNDHLDEKAYAKSLFKNFGWGMDQFPALDTLWEHESNWNPLIGNLAGSGAYGIPQALPANKMASEGADWATNPDTQIRWGLKYIAQSYGNPDHAWSHWLARIPIGGRDVGNWYGSGGIFNGPQQIGVGERGPEAVIPLNNAGVATLATAFGHAVSAADLSTMLQAGHGEKVTYHYESTHIDHSTHFDGDITVQAQDPMEMERKLAARKRLTNLTRGGGGKR